MKSKQIPEDKGHPYEYTTYKKISLSYLPTPAGRIWHKVNF